MSPSIAVIIPSLNSPIIDQVLAAVEEQEGIDLVDEFLVVGKDDYGYISTGQRAHLLDTKKPVLPGCARNMGIEATRAELLFFLDGDCLPQEGWLREHLAAHAAGYAVVSGGVLPGGDDYWQLSYNLTMFHEYLTTNSPGKRQFLPTLNLSVTRDVFDAAGVFDTTMRRGEDVEWSTRVRRTGQELYFQPAARIFHAHGRNTLQAVWNDCADSGYHMRQVRLNNPDILQAPEILRHRHLLALFSPIIASWVTLSIVLQKPSILRKYANTIPAIYMTKIAWCLGASRQK